MKITVYEVSSIERKIRVDFEWKDVEEQYDSTLNKLRRKLKVDGFRPGKVPTDVAKRSLGPQLSYDFTNAVIESNYKDVLKEQDIEKFIDLNISGVDFDAGKTFYFEMTVEFDPEVKLLEYKKGFPIKKTVYVLDKEDVELYLEDIREHHAEVIEISDGAQKDHYILCDLQETDGDGVPLVGKKVANRMIKVGEGIYGEPGSETLIGAKAGDEVHIQFKPKKGDKINYVVSVKRVESHALPKLTDDFIKNNFKTIDNYKTLREEVEKLLQGEWDSRTEKEYLRGITEYFVEKVTIDVPKSRIKRFLDNVIEDMLAKNGGKEIDDQKLREQYRPIAEREIRWYLIQEAISKAENIKVTKAETDQKIQEMAEQYPNENRDAVLKYYRKAENRSHLETDLHEQKIFDCLKESVKVKKETINTKDFRKRNM
ncbi:MAG: trigger factor [Candidatus Marinimicrobia bacterium]|nr:trigger factor [Candidatus Neomarinimicrobiota bacterium]